MLPTLEAFRHALEAIQIVESSCGQTRVRNHGRNTHIEVFGMTIYNGALD